MEFLGFLGPISLCTPDFFSEGGGTSVHRLDPIFTENSSRSQFSYTGRTACELFCIRSRNQRDRVWPPIGHKHIFCAQSETSIRMSRGINWFAKSSIPWALPPVLKIFCRLFADLTDRPWVSDDGWRPTELSLLLKFQFVLRGNNNNANLIFNSF